MSMSWQNLCNRQAKPIAPPHFRCFHLFSPQILHLPPLLLTSISSPDPHLKSTRKSISDLGRAMFPGASRFLGAAGLFGGDSDPLPWCDNSIIAGCELNAGEETEEKIMALCWGLVHSRVAADVNRGIMMLLVSVERGGDFPLKTKHYLIAVGHFRNREYGKSMDHLNICLQIDPKCNQALELRTLLTDKIKRDGALGICIATGAVGALGFAAAGMLGAAGAVTLAAGGVLTMVRRT